jgi:signal transduction histidine kinase
MEGWGWKTVHDPETLPLVLEKWTNSIVNGEAFEMVFPLKGVDGNFRPFLTRVVPVHDKSGKIIRWFGSNTDITKQIELEQQKDNFIAMASHELKTPVTVIKAYTHIIHAALEKEGHLKLAEQVSKIDLQINKLTALVEALLDVTKMQRGNLQYKMETFIFNELVKESCELIQETTKQHKIEIYFDETVSVTGDKERIGQAITNFITNAIKYSPYANKIVVQTKLDKENVKFCVTDFGIGISQSNQQKVFEQFFRVSENQQNTFPGVGLGLYISSEIIHRHGGKIWVTSQEGKGSEFCFSLPIG